MVYTIYIMIKRNLSNLSQFLSNSLLGPQIMSKQTTNPINE
jgi:hypothetical protein